MTFDSYSIGFPTGSFGEHRLTTIGTAVVSTTAFFCTVFRDGASPWSARAVTMVNIRVTNFRIGLQGRTEPSTFVYRGTPWPLGLAACLGEGGRGAVQSYQHPPMK